MQLMASSTLKVSVAPNGATGEATLSAGTLPAGVTATFAPASLKLDGTTTATAVMTLKTADSTPPGDVTVDVSASPRRAPRRCTRRWAWRCSRSSPSTSPPA